MWQLARLGAIAIWSVPALKTVRKSIRRPFDADQLKSPHGRVEILWERCKGCGFCVEFCPRNVLELSTEFNLKGYHPPRMREPDLCVACGFCEMICPEFAIYIVEEEELPATTATQAG